MTSIDVCICTFRRPSLRQTLESVAHQRVEGTKVRVIVADNDEHPGLREQIETMGKSLRLSLRYVHAPARNISTARNACLQSATAEWIAFVDDDEVATPTWLAQLRLASADRDVVFGVSQALYEEGTPEWIRRGDFHSNRLSGNDPTWNGYTANVLIRRKFVEAAELSFEVALGQSGGEDTMFFFDAMLAGARFGYAPNAIVTERTEPSRATLKWLLLRRFRSGQIHYLLLRRQGRQRVDTIAAAAKAMWALGAALCSLPRPARAASHLGRSSLHAGVLAAAAGFAPYPEYRSQDRDSCDAVRLRSYR